MPRELKLVAGSSSHLVFDKAVSAYTLAATVFDGDELKQEQKQLELGQKTADTAAQ